MRQRLLFPLLGIDSDNDSEFTLAPCDSTGFNDLLYRYYLDEKITFIAPAHIRKTIRYMSNKRIGLPCSTLLAITVKKTVVMMICGYAQTSFSHLKLIARTHWQSNYQTV